MDLVDWLLPLFLALPFLGFLVRSSLVEEELMVDAEKDVGNNNPRPKSPVKSNFFIVFVF
ncbi:MAG TPA: hypothetical protein DF603_11755 [Chryseobacterium sp.]|nr:hypothetical protein [Chryseobacterium sp.]